MIDTYIYPTIYIVPSNQFWHILNIHTHYTQWRWFFFLLITWMMRNGSLMSCAGQEAVRVETTNISTRIIIMQVWQDHQKLPFGEFCGGESRKKRKDCSHVQIHHQWSSVMILILIHRTLIKAWCVLIQMIFLDPFLLGLLFHPDFLRRILWLFELEKLREEINVVSWIVVIYIYIFLKIYLYFTF